MAMAQFQALRNSGAHMAATLGLRWSHALALPPPFGGIVERNLASPSLVLPEDSNGIESFRFGFPSFSFGGSLELMAVPKRKTSPHKRGIRNGPKALKPTPVIVRCKSCGRVKLPHFYCCSGDRGSSGDQSDNTR